MLIALLPTQVSDHWDAIKGDLESSLPPHADYGPYNLNNILYGLMIGVMQCWLFTEEDQQMKGFLITTVLDDISGVQTLLIYCAVIVDKQAKINWKREFDTLETYAKARHCAKIAAFVSNEKLIAFLKDKGAETRFVFAHVNV